MDFFISSFDCLINNTHLHPFEKSNLTTFESLKLLIKPMLRFILFFAFSIFIYQAFAQIVGVRADYDAAGNCNFTAYNNAPTPMFLNIEFADLQNTTFNENLPYVKMLMPGLNNLFVLIRYPDSDVPRFNYQIRSYRSNPIANVNLDFPYLIPLASGKTATVFDVENIDGFWGDEKIKNWAATGFNARPGDSVYAARQGEIVEIEGNVRIGDPEFWYNTWTNSITVLQPDGSLITYKNVIDRYHKLKLNQKIFAGQLLGEVAPYTAGVIVLIYHNSLRNDDFLFVIPQFVTEPGKVEMVNQSMNINVIHPNEVRALEMTKKEQRKVLNK